MKLTWLNPRIPQFPDTRHALSEPNGLLAAGGQLSLSWLLEAYSRGIFPWFNEGDPVLWWTPSPRMVIYPQQFHISRSLRKALRRGDYRVTVNNDFAAVIAACALPRSEVNTNGPYTWITPVMFAAYRSLHAAGYAHSIEVWRENQLIGGLYGVALGQVFFGESMFSFVSNGSKIALSHLVAWLQQWHYQLIDCQVYNDHLSSLGAVEIERSAFEQLLTRCGVNQCRVNQGGKDRCNDHSQVTATDELGIWKPQDITQPACYWNTQ